MGKNSKSVLKYYTKLPLKADSKCQNYQCNYCQKQYAENVTRMQKHLVDDCKKCPSEIKLLF